VNRDLAQAAANHSTNMVAQDYFEHVGPDHRTPVQRIFASGYANSHDAYLLGENIAYGTNWLATPAEIVAAWMDSPPHRTNILDGQYRDTGIGVAPAVPAKLAGGQPGATYTEDFGFVSHR
jgi:uncharacterized protein YkwD